MLCCNALHCQTLLAQKPAAESSVAPLVFRSSEGLLIRYFRELRARHLYAVAEQACQYRLERTRLGRVERADARGRPLRWTLGTEYIQLRQQQNPGGRFAELPRQLGCPVRKLRRARGGRTGAGREGRRSRGQLLGPIGRGVGL